MIGAERVSSLKGWLLVGGKDTGARRLGPGETLDLLHEPAFCARFLRLPALAGQLCWVQLSGARKVVMADATKIETAASGQRNWFTTTHWSLILNAQDTSSPLAASALEKLCRVYWYPLYVYIRRQGEDEEPAKDLTQGFFACLLEKRYLAQVQREKGKFRSFLLASLKHFLSDERDKARAQKRGGGHSFVSLDDSTGEERYRLELVDVMDPEKLFERRWALALLEQARTRLKEEYWESGKSSLYDRLKVLEAGDKNAPPYTQVGVELGLTESGVKSAVFRLRQRYRELVREEVAHTVESPEEVDGEIRYLISVISG